MAQAPDIHSPLAWPDSDWAWAPFRPGTERPWTPGLARHLLRRAGFGVTGAGLHRAHEQGMTATVDECLAVPSALPPHAAMFQEREAAAARSGGAGAFTAWWLRRLAESPSPFQEKLALFWHEHFAIASDAVPDATTFQRHVALLHQHARGPLAPLVRALFDDPAVYLGLGGAENRRGKPNAVFARAWLDAFTLGPGVAADRDVGDAARALTGWFVYGGKLRYIEREHDAGPKEVLGHSGNLERADLARILASHPATARRLALRVFRWFVSEATPPSEALLAPLAAAFQRGDPVVSIVETVLRSNLFYSEQAIGQRVLSPVELVIGLVRSLEAVPPTLPLVDDLGRLGQRLDRPPTAGGWPAGTDWINTWALAGRVELCRALVEGGGAYGQGLDAWEPARRSGCVTAGEGGRFWIRLLLPETVATADRDAILLLAQRVPANADGMRRVLGAILPQPEFQVG